MQNVTLQVLTLHANSLEAVSKLKNLGSMITSVKSWDAGMLGDYLVE